MVENLSSSAKAAARPRSSDTHAADREKTTGRPVHTTPTPCPKYPLTHLYLWSRSQTAVNLRHHLPLVPGRPVTTLLEPFLRDGYLLYRSRVFEHIDRHAGVQMPADVAMERPGPGIVGGGLPHHVPVGSELLDVPSLRVRRIDDPTVPFAVTFGLEVDEVSTQCKMAAPGVILPGRRNCGRESASDGTAATCCELRPQLASQVGVGRKEPGTTH
jgi:hypothetical protein